MSSNILLNVLDIYLDTDNPRHSPIHDQPKIIKHLIKKDGVKNLARHISLNGVNPLDSIGVIKDEEGNYVVVEGNRRLCALLLLNDPDKAPTSEVNYFRRLSDNSSNIPNSMNCVLFDDEQEALVWMGIRHNGEQSGIGIKSWDSKQRTRHNSRINKKDPNAMALAILEYAVEKDILHSENTDRVITTAARYLGNPFFRETFGIISSRSEQDVVIDVPFEEFNRMLVRFCEDLVNTTVVHSRTKKEHWIEYAKMLIEMGIAPKTKTAPQLLLDGLKSDTVKEPQIQVPDTKNEVTEQSSTNTDNNKMQDAGNHKGSESKGGRDQSDSGSKGKTKTGANSKNPDTRRFIIPHDFKVSINDKTLRRIYKEMSEILIDDHTLAVSLITRAFLENLYDLFHEKVGGHYLQQQTHQIMDKVIKLIEKDSELTIREKDALAALRRVQSNEKNVLSPKTLGANAHGSIYPNARELKREFDNLSAIIMYMLKRI